MTTIIHDGRPPHLRYEAKLVMREKTMRNDFDWYGAVYLNTSTGEQIDPGMKCSTPAKAMADFDWWWDTGVLP